MDPIARLTEYFRDFPGIGPRQARRFVYYLLTRNNTVLEDIARLILDVKKSVRICDMCFRFFTVSNQGNFKENYNSKNGNSATHARCSQCSDPNRDRTRLMIVARDADFESIEKSRAYNGLYFILGGTVPILEKEPEARVRSRELLARVGNDSAIKEIILSLNATSDGEHTADYLRGILNEINIDQSFEISVLGRGLSTGSELEYADADTIKSALNNRSAK